MLKKNLPIYNNFIYAGIFFDPEISLLRILFQKYNGKNMVKLCAKLFIKAQFLIAKD